jgi:hypothetical protein
MCAENITEDCRYDDFACAEGFVCIEEVEAWDCIIENEAPAGTNAPVSLTLLSPVPNQPVGSTLPIVISVENINLVPYWNSSPREGQAHLHIYVDGEPLVPEDQGLAESRMNLFVNELAEENDSVHTLRVTLHNNDHTPHPTIDDIELEWIKLPEE